MRKTGMDVNKVGEEVGFEIGRVLVGNPVNKLNIEIVGTRVGGILLKIVGALENIAQLIGISVGEPAVGNNVGFELGLMVGILVGLGLGLMVGILVGLGLGLIVGILVGLGLSLIVGILVGLVVGIADGLLVGLAI